MEQTVDNKTSKGDKSFDVDKGADGKPQVLSISERSDIILFSDVAKQNLVCQVPKLIWVKAWKRLSRSARQGQPEAFDYVDRRHKTVLIVKTLLKEEEGGDSYSVNAEIKVRSLAGTNNIYNQLKLFSDNISS